VWILGTLNKIARRLGLISSRVPEIRLIDMATIPLDDKIPLLDRKNIDESKLTPEQKTWRRDGALVLPGFMPEALLDAYAARRAAEAGPGGWLMGSPYVHVPEMRDLTLYPPLMEMMKSLIGEDMLLHLCLTGWVSTEREWHQDEYLSADFVNSWYAAVWIAVGDIHPDCGPFEYVPGTQPWPLINGEKVRSFLSPEERERRDPNSGDLNWPKLAERFVTPAYDYEIARHQASIVPFIAKKGDVLIWHGRLVHRGSLARQLGMERRSRIAHYTGVTHRPDMPARAAHETGGLYALFDTPLIV
jgi:hypothetical protein